MKKLPVKKFKRYEIIVVYCFGSRVHGIETNLSDTDIGVVFKNQPKLNNINEIYQTLYDEFSKLFPPTFENDLDIVFLQKAQIAFQYNVIKEGKILYETAPAARADFEDRVIKMYIDFKPILDYFDKIDSERLSS